MSGYAGADVDAEHALILNENALYAVRQLMDSRPSLQDCEDCGDHINPLRLAALGRYGCRRCVPCQTQRDKQPKQKIKMLDRIL